MIEKIKNYKPNLIEIFLILSPFIDLFTAITERRFDIPLSIGIIIRALFILFLVGFTFFKSTYKHKKLSIAFLFLIALYSVIYTVNIYTNKGAENVFFEIKNLIKTFYFPICLVGLLNYIATKQFKFNPKLMVFIILEYITLLFIPVFFNIGFESYAEDKIGTIGWFFSGNEISAIYAILFAFIIFSYDYIENKAIYLGLVLFSLNTVIQIGTKIPAIAVIFAIIVFIIVKIIRKIMEKKKIHKRFILSCSALIISSSLVIAFSPVVINYGIYKDYLISTREAVTASANEENPVLIEDGVVLIGNKIEGITPEQANNLGLVQENVDISNNNQNEKNENSDRLTENEVATVIHSGRMETKNKIQEKFNNASFGDKMIGLGKLDINNNSQNLCEIDYYDILFTFGIIGFIVYFIPVLVLVFLILKKLIKTDIIKQIISSNSLCCFAIAGVTGIVLCAIAGHTFTSPDVSIYIAIALLEVYFGVKSISKV